MEPTGQLTPMINKPCCIAIHDGKSYTLHCSEKESPVLAVNTLDLSPLMECFLEAQEMGF